MYPKLAIVLSLSVAVTACSRIADSRFNPLNWFGSSTPIVASDAALRPLVSPGDLTVVVDGRQPVEQVTSLVIDRAPDGAIITASGLSRGSGYFNAELVLVEQSGGTLTYAFRAEGPTTRSGQQGIIAATTLTNAERAGVGTIRVLGADGGRSIRR